MQNSINQSKHYSDFKNVFVNSNNDFYKNAVSKDNKLDIFESRKEYFKSIIYGKNRIKVIDKEYKFDEGSIVISTDFSGKITYASHKFCDISGYDRDELLNMNYTQMLHPSVPKSIFYKMFKVLHKVKQWNGIVKNIRKDGKYYWLNISIVQIVSNGVLVGYSSSIRPALDSELNYNIPLD
ncbi:putative Signal transduction sensor histidine kinase [Sulfurovum sp. enrichment culture clone C5]|uniref:Putative Signal transduction sensor histidine kinase n=1 Tax=Sulfurovum sp. enrichment culture clone C5 TaxID=497650 RepID=A0A0S4XPR1_9BACT|nr:putative Signal transduction sensor histidine kinase [Sulfurovum sp. enrichment culture clone C5]